MKSILAATGVVLACSVALGAQSTPQAPRPDAPEKQPSRSHTASRPSSESVTLSGCLREGTEPNTFILANAEPVERQPSGASTPRPETGGSTSGSVGSSATASGGSTGTAVTGSSAGPTDTTRSVRLVGNADLQAHVNHEVQVTGTMVPQGKGSMQGQMPGQAQGTSGSTGSAAGETVTDTTSRAGEHARDAATRNMHTLHVQSVKMVGGDCARK